MRLRLSSKPSPPHHSTPATCGSPENSWYAFTPAVSSWPASRSTSSTLRPPTPPLELTCCTAASREFFVIVPTKPPTPENGAITPTLMVSPAPARLGELPDEHAANTGAAAVLRPAIMPHRKTCRRETSDLTIRG